MYSNRPSIFFAIVLLLSSIAEARHFKVGFAKQDITPTKATPMWGYGARHAALSIGVRDPLYAKAVVIDVGTEKLALVGLDPGRSPTDAMMVRIRAAIKATSGIGLIMMSGSHTHHGPVIELLDEPGKGQGTFDDAVACSSELEGKIIALVVNYAAHPTMLEAADLRFSAEWPGAMMNAVEEQLSTNCIFMQGASGDLSAMSTEETRGIDAFGKAMAVHVYDSSPNYNNPDQSGARSGRRIRGVLLRPWHAAQTTIQGGGNVFLWLL